MFCRFASKDWEEKSEKLGSKFGKSSVVGILSEEVLRRAKRQFDDMFGASKASFHLLVIVQVSHDVLGGAGATQATV